MSETRKLHQRGGRRENQTGRPRVHPGGTVTVAISLPKDMLEQVDAARGSFSRSDWVRRAIGLHLADVPAPHDPEVDE